jgi:cell division protein FtsB
MGSERTGSEFRRFRRPRVPGSAPARRLFWGGLVVLFVYLLVFSDFGLLRRWQLAREEARIEAAILELEARRQALGAEQDLLEDDAYLERIAREEHGMVGQGEHVYHLAPPDTSGGNGKRR